MFAGRFRTASRGVLRFLQRSEGARRVNISSSQPATGKRHLVLKSLGALSLVLGASGGAIYYLDEGTRRSMHFWYHIFPIYIQYRYVQIKGDLQKTPENELDAEYNELHTKYAPLVEKLCFELKGMYLKNAQFVSTRDEFIPAQYMAFCKRAQNQVPTEFSPEEVKVVLESSLKRPLSQVFSEFHETPLGAASIGQAHLARLVDGRQVVVKVMYPGIEHRFRSDLNTMRAFCRMAMPQHLPALDEMERQYLTEFDYVGEADNMQEIHDNMLKAFPNEVVVPRPYRPLCSQNVLVMTYVEGVPLVDGIRNYYRKYAESKGMTLEALEEEEKRAYKEGRKAKRTIDEEHRRMQLYGVLQLIHDYSLNALRALYNLTVGMLPLIQKLQYQWAPPLIDLGKIMEVLNRVHAHQMFIDGCFNGDPHPGNVLLCPDGRLGLIDYGQVKRVAPDVRVGYAKIIISIAEDRKEDCIQAYKDIGFRTKHNNGEVLWKTARFWNDSDDPELLDGKNVHAFMEWAHETDPITFVPNEYVMFSRVSVLLRGVANAFGLQMRTAVLWKPKAKECLKNAGIEF